MGITTKHLNHGLRGINTMTYHTVCPCCEKRAKRSEIKKGVYECYRCCIEGEWK